VADATKNTELFMVDDNAVTVIVAVRNGEPFIGEAVQSALAQGDLVRGVIVVDDGSTDSTLASICALNSRRVTVVSNPGRGVSAARNFGATLADTRWLLFLDADDRLVGGGLASLLDAAGRERSAIVAYGDYERINRAGQRIGRRFLIRSRGKPSGCILPQIIRGNFIINGGIAIVDRAAFWSSEGFDPRLSLCEDWHLWCRLAASGQFVYTAERVMDYREHDGSVMMTRFRDYADFEPALVRIFSDESVLAKLPPHDVALARREAEVSLMTYCATQAIRHGAVSPGLRIAREAMRRYRARVPWVMLRLAGAMARI
jgi:glycosyltransferase involved in cell wall biosynthesis